MATKTPTSETFTRSRESRAAPCEGAARLFKTIEPSILFLFHYQTQGDRARALPRDRLPTKNRQDFARDVARVDVRRQEDISGRELLRLRRSFHSSVGAELRNLLAIFGLHVERSPYRPWSDGVNANSPFHQILRQRFGEGVDRTLRGRVVEESLLTFETCDRPGVDDARPLLHPRHRSLCKIEVTEEVRAESPLKLLGGDVLNRFLILLE